MERMYKETPTREENKRTITEGEAERLRNETLDRQKRETQRKHAEETIAELDGLLDDIEAVLEPEAEVFLAAYIQKGGE